MNEKKWENEFRRLFYALAFLGAAGFLPEQVALTLTPSGPLFLVMRVWALT